MQNLPPVASFSTKGQELLNTAFSLFYELVQEFNHAPSSQDFASPYWSTKKNVMLVLRFQAIECFLKERVLKTSPFLLTADLGFLEKKPALTKDFRKHHMWGPRQLMHVYHLVETFHNRGQTSKLPRRLIKKWHSEVEVRNEFIHGLWDSEASNRNNQSSHATFKCFLQEFLRESLAMYHAFLPGSTAFRYHLEFLELKNGKQAAKQMSQYLSEITTLQSLWFNRYLRLGNIITQEECPACANNGTPNKLLLVSTAGLKVCVICRNRFPTPKLTVISQAVIT